MMTKIDIQGGRTVVLYVCKAYLYIYSLCGLIVCREIFNFSVRTLRPCDM